MNEFQKKAESQKKLTDKNIRILDNIIRTQYRKSSERIINDFEATYDKILAGKKDDKVTPADLYRLDRYWKLQGQLKTELQRLGDKQISILSAIFEKNFWDIYNSTALESLEEFTTLDKEAAKQMINRIWNADGKTWSQRVWENTDKLQQTLNEHLVDCVLTGRTTSELKKILQEQFNVSYKRSDALVRTEMARVQTDAAIQRYKDYGIQELEMWVDEDERTCPICAKLDGKKYPIGANIPLPAHPRCRCCVIPVA